MLVATNISLSRQNTSFVATKVCWSGQNYVCRDILLSRQILVSSRQAYFCRDKSMLVSTKHLLRQNCRDKTFVATNICVCRDKHTFVATIHVFVPIKVFVVAIVLLRQKTFVATSILLSRLSQTHVFVATKMILVAAPANEEKR